MQKFQPNQEGVKQIFEFIISEYEKNGIDKFKTNGDITPSVIFLAGAPGAGKTEFIESIENNHNFIIIDIDKYRILFDGYAGKNASEFQGLSTKVANKIYSYCIKNDLNVIVDGTFGNENVVEQNISMCIKHKRDFGVVLIYQDPLLSYYYTKLREIEGKRNVPKDVFIEKFLNSINNAFEIKKKYTDIFFLFAYKNSKGLFNINKKIVDKKSFDKKIGISYNNDILNGLIDNLDELFRKKLTIRYKIKFLFKSIIEILGLKKKEKKKKNNLKN
ncbi:MAG: zeta toxin family protein [Candidatus Gracilibacteria bacterium]|nr:zeta toxin family protein [Candidatus Gracilibacteria bacterium]